MQRNIRSDEIVGIFRNPNVTSEFVAEILQRVPKVLPRRFILGPAICPAATKEQLADVFSRYQGDDVIRLLAENSSTPPAILADLFKIACTEDGYLLGTLLRNLSTPKSTLAPFLTRKSSLRTEIFRRVTKGDLAISRKQLWEDLASNPSLTVDEQLGLARYIPNPQALYKNKALDQKIFDYLWDKGVWRGSYFKSSYCSREQLAELCQLAPDDEQLSARGYRDIRCPRHLVSEARSGEICAKRIAAWANESVDCDWHAVDVDDDMAIGVAQRSDLPCEVAMRIAKRGDESDEDNDCDDAKCALAANPHLYEDVVIELHRQGIDVLKNPNAPKWLLTEAISDESISKYKRVRALQNPQLSEDDLREFINLPGRRQSMIEDKPSPGDTRCGFYRLQDRLREEGWYVEWTFKVQGNHAWEDMPLCHKEGPFEGLEIDREKCLLSITGDGPDFDVPEYLTDEQAEEWLEEAYALLDDGDFHALEALTSPEFVKKFLEPTPESWGGNHFMFNPDGDGPANLEKVHHLIEKCGCSYTYKDCAIVISWGEDGKRSS